MNEILLQEDFTNLVNLKDGVPTTTSLSVAEKFNKEHENVIQKIEALQKDILAGLKLSPLKLFSKSEYLDAQNKPRVMYDLTRDGFTLLVMGFTGKEALEWKLKYIEAFNRMEQLLHSTTLQDNRLELARIIQTVPTNKLTYIARLYPEYFSQVEDPNSLEYRCEVNTSYVKWLEDFDIDSEWIKNFPTVFIYDNYLLYCHNHNYQAMGKKVFFKQLENDYALVKYQRSNGSRYFKSA